MKPQYVYKLTDQNNKTYGGFLWTKGKWAPVLTGTCLCAPGVYHAYHTPELALLLNPIHSNFSHPKLWKAEIRGNIIDTDNGLKLGATEMQLIKEIPVTQPTTEQRIIFALLCAKEVCKDPAFNTFADNWVRGKDRTEKTAAAAARAAAAAAARAAAEAAEAAAWAAAEAAAEAAAARASYPLEMLKRCAEQAYALNPES